MDLQWFYEDVLGQSYSPSFLASSFNTETDLPCHPTNMTTELLHAGRKTSRPPPLPPSPTTGKYNHVLEIKKINTFPLFVKIAVTSHTADATYHFEAQKESD